MLYPALLFLVLLFACNKEATELKSVNSNGCIEQVVIPVSQHSIADSDVLTVNEHFAKTTIDISHFRYYAYQHDSVQTYYPPYAKFDSKNVGVDQYANGLRIFDA